MPIFSRAMFGLVDWAARKGLSDSTAPPSREAAKQRARRTGVRGETYAYWYLRRQGYVMIARNFTYRGMKGEIDLVGYDGETVAFVEVKTRTAVGGEFGCASRGASRGAPAQRCLCCLIGTSPALLEFAAWQGIVE